MALQIIKDLIHELQEIQNYIENLEQTNTKYDIGDIKLDYIPCEVNDTMSIVDHIYIPEYTHSQKCKCSKCNSNRMIKLNDSNFFNHYVMCDCFKSDVSISPKEYSGVTFYSPCVGNLFVGQRDGETFIFPYSSIKEKYSKEDHELAYIAYTTEQECLNYCNGG